ncbi:MAG: hypothetical protein C0456_05210 [Hyphomonas sp.]|uniref:hypothetical protein n=1 Tax=Hyphomonas sp. TaxID=87 RepID=UPI001D3108D5|nr:hypothetical protein [Hyphomonas sp.]MBA4226013.1 hypothetical protein [Hyphomonas sp.]
MSLPDRPKPEVFHRLRRPPVRFPRVLKITALVFLGLMVLMFAGCAWLFGGLLASSLERVEPTRALILSVTAEGGFAPAGDPRLAEGARLSPEALARLNAQIAETGGALFITKPGCTAHSYRGTEEQEGDFVTCLAQADFLNNVQRLVEVVWVRQRGAWYVDDFTMQDARADE